MRQPSQRPQKGNQIGIEALKRLSSKHIIWWYGQLTKNPQGRAIPKVAVLVRKIDDQGQLGNPFYIYVNLSDLGLIRIGSIWDSGYYHGEWKYETRVFKVDFSAGNWRYFSEGDPDSTPVDEPISTQHPLKYSRDWSWLLDFDTEGGKRLLIPCLEFFTRMYGKSVELRRVLAVYDWQEAETRLFGRDPSDHVSSSNHWYVKLGSRMYNDDAVFLAHVLHDSFTKLAAKRVYSEIANKLDKNAGAKFCQFGPWFQGPASLMVSGFWMNGNQTFVALRIEGASDPKGYSIDRDRVLRGTRFEDPPQGGAKPADPPELTFILKPVPITVSITDDQVPGGGSGSTEIQEPVFILIGTPREIRDLPRDGGESTVRVRHGGSEEERLVSPDEPHGDGKGVKRGSLHTPIELQGVLLDVWASAESLVKDGLLKSLRCVYYNEQGKLGYRPDVCLIPLASEKNKDGTPTNPSRWAYFEYTKTKKTIKGMLVMELVGELKTVYLVEVQRKFKNKQPQVTSAAGSVTTAGELSAGEGEKSEGDTSTVKVPKEYSLSGMMFLLDNPNDLASYLLDLRAIILRKEGVMASARGGIAGKAAVFTHKPLGVEGAPYKLRLQNALIDFGAVQRPKKVQNSAVEAEGESAEG